MKHQLFLTGLLLVSAGVHAVQDTDIVGTWRTVDDKTKLPKAIIKIEQQANGAFTGTYVNPISTPKYTVCQNCPAPFTGQPIKGLQLLWALKSTGATSHQYQHGNILDPATGKVYSCKADLSDDGNTLNVRGYMGISLLGRTQTWTRDKTK